jgi:NAD(P)-dependent dehydrogenase (short-subunit alcohol dehydrogenase family)
MRVLITGAGRAIGKATAIELRDRGHEVVATARDPSLLGDLDGVEALELDVRSDESVRAAIGAAGELDAVVNNAALSVSGPLEGYPVDTFAATLDTNVTGVLRVVQAVLPAWRERGSGVIVNISSVQGQVSTPMEGAYAASKYALEALSETMHYELRHFGIRTVIIQPGYIAPGMKHPVEHKGPGSTTSSAASGSGPRRSSPATRGARRPTWRRPASRTRSRTPTRRCACRSAPTPR